jgi:hypothetical protein
VGVELGLAQAAELAPNHRLVPLAVPPKNKWATAAHHRGLVLRPVAAEALAVEAATIREPAAIEAAAAWAAADTAVVDIAVAVAVE